MKTMPHGRMEMGSINYILDFAKGISRIHLEFPKFHFSQSHFLDFANIVENRQTNISMYYCYNFLEYENII